LPKLKPISHNELLRGLRSFGFDGPFAGGRHLYMIRGNLRLTVPNPHREKALERFWIFCENKRRSSYLLQGGG
jgi:hypothetical protein